MLVLSRFLPLLALLGKPPADPMVRHQHEFPLERSYTAAAAAVARWA